MAVAVVARDGDESQAQWVGRIVLQQGCFDIQQMGGGGAGMGSPTKRTDANRATILRALKLGATYKLAAEAAGMTYTTLNEWMHDDPEFSEAVKKAEATRAQAAMRSIEKAAKEGQWQAAAWYLERRYPHEYGRTVQEHTGEQALNITISKRREASERESEQPKA